MWVGPNLLIGVLLQLICRGGEAEELGSTLDLDPAPIFTTIFNPDILGAAPDSLSNSTSAPSSSSTGSSNSSSGTRTETGTGTGNERALTRGAAGSPLPNNNVNLTTSSLHVNDMSLESLAEEVGTWEAPAVFQKRFPYYLSGYDDDDRPIWISEMGKYNARETLDGGAESVENLNKYVKQAAYRILHSIHMQSVDEILFIIDFDGLDLSQVSHTPTILFILNLVRTYRDLIENHLGSTIIINANYFAEILINLLRPAFGRVMERTEVYGTQQSKWIPVLRRLLPPHTIPTWYGGHQNYKPISIYG